MKIAKPKGRSVVLVLEDLEILSLHALLDSWLDCMSQEEVSEDGGYGPAIRLAKLLQKEIPL